MILRYLDYNNINIDELLNNNDIDYVELIFKNNKICLFILGILFAKGKKIKILNKDKLNLENVSKSFLLMCYVWDRLSEDNFPNFDYSNVITDMDNKIENIKRLGIRVSKINNKVIDDKIFLICPVREADNNQKLWIENYVKEKEDEGYIVHAPHMHTRQIDLFGGYAICRQNAENLSSSSEVNIYYDKNSFGSVFDLGVAYSLHKPLVVLNDINLDDNDIIDNIIINWPYNNKIKKKVREKKQ